jgi:hypothetical protein
MRLLHTLRASFLRNSFFHVLETSLSRLLILHLVDRCLYLITLEGFIGTVESVLPVRSDVESTTTSAIMSDVACCVCNLQQQKNYCKIVVC